MSGNYGWKPASTSGIIPLRPMDFGEVLGRSFSALRHNPRVLLGFAIGLSAVTSIIGAVVASFMFIEVLRRMSTFRAQEMQSEEAMQVLQGSLALIAVVGFGIAVLGMLVDTVVRAVVAAEVGGAVVAEKQTLGEIWRRVRSAIWRILGFTLIVAGMIVAAFVVLFVITFLLGRIGVILFALALLAAIPVTVWLVTKLSLTSAIIVLEEARIGQAMKRSWQLTKGFFWKVTGVWLLITIIFGFVGNIIGTAFGWLGDSLFPVVAPTGDQQVEFITQLLTASLIPTAFAAVVSAIGTVVTGTGLTIAYIDTRMGKEGLDLDLQTYIEDRDAGRTVPANPYLYDPNRTPRQRPNAFGAPQFGTQGFGTQGYGTPGYTPPGYGTQQGSPYAPPVTPPSSGDSAGGYAPPYARPSNEPRPFFPTENEDSQGR